MRVALEDLWAHGAFSSQDASTFAGPVNRYVDILNEFTIPEIDRAFYADQFKIEMHKPYVFGIHHTWSTGVSLMKEVDDCGLDSLEQVVLNSEIQKATFHSFLLDLPSLCHHPDSLVLYEQEEDLEEPLDIESAVYGFGAWLQSPTSYVVSPCPFWQIQSAIEEPLPSFGCYPNPVRTHLTVVFDMEEKLPNELVVLDLTGRELIRLKQPKVASEFDLSHCSSGTYILQAIWEDGDTKAEVFHIQH
jgi:hypothetical protein